MSVASAERIQGEGVLTRARNIAKRYRLTLGIIGTAAVTFPAAQIYTKYSEMSDKVEALQKCNDAVKAANTLEIFEEGRLSAMGDVGEYAAVVNREMDVLRKVCE